MQSALQETFVKFLHYAEFYTNSIFFEWIISSVDKEFFTTNLINFTNCIKNTK